MKKLKTKKQKKDSGWPVWRTTGQSDRQTDRKTERQTYRQTTRHEQIDGWMVCYIFSTLPPNTAMLFPLFKTGRGETRPHLYRQINQSQTSAKHRGIIDVWFSNVKCLVMNTTDITPLDRDSSLTHSHLSSCLSLIFTHSLSGVGRHA